MRIPLELYNDLMFLEVFSEFKSVDKSSNFGEASERFNEFKIALNSNYKRLARKLHPDLGGDEDKMKELSAARDRLNSLHLRRPRPPMIFHTIFNFGDFSTASNTSNTSTSTTTVFYSSTSGGFR